MEKPFSLKENSYHIDNLFMVEIDPELVCLLRQSRSSMSESGIEDLVSSIIMKGQKTPGDIYAFTASEAINYVKEMNDLWDTDYRLEDFPSFYIKEKEDYFYLFLVAGHRRLKACKHLGYKYVANIYFENCFENAIEWQLAENVQREELSLLDLITSATAYWIKLKKKDPKLTMKNFAQKHIHKSVSWLNNALRFSRLPLLVQELIKKTESYKGVNYGIMLQFAKLYDFSVEKEKVLDQDLLLSYISHTVTHKFDLEKVKKFCEDRRDEICGQQQMFVLEAPEVDKNSLIAIRKNKTLHMSQATSYLNAVGPIANHITGNCRAKAREVVAKCGILNI